MSFHGWRGNGRKIVSGIPRPVSVRTRAGECPHRKEGRGGLTALPFLPFCELPQAFPDLQNQIVLYRDAADLTVSHQQERRRCGTSRGRLRPPPTPPKVGLPGLGGCSFVERPQGECKLGKGPAGPFPLPLTPRGGNPSVCCGRQLPLHLRTETPLWDVPVLRSAYL